MRLGVALVLGPAKLSLIQPKIFLQRRLRLGIPNVAPRLTRGFLFFFIIINLYVNFVDLVFFFLPSHVQKYHCRGTNLWQTSFNQSLINQFH